MMPNMVNRQPIQIGLCDDDPVFIKEYTPTIRDVMLNEVGLTYELQVYTTTEALLKEIKMGKRFDILLLDIVFKGGMDGRELADRIRDYDMTVKILFVSTEEDVADSLFPYQPSGYIKKSDRHESTLKQLTEAVNKINVNYINLPISPGDRKVYDERIFLGDVLYIDVVGRYAQIHKYTRDGSAAEDMITRLPLNDIEAIVAKNRLFVRVNRNVLVNFQYVNRFDIVDSVRPMGRRKYYVELRTGQQINVGDRYLTKVKLMYSRYGK